MLQKYFFENRKETDLCKNIKYLNKLAREQNYDGNHFNIYS